MRTPSTCARQADPGLRLGPVSPACRVPSLALVLLVLPALTACSGNASTDRPPLPDSVFTAILVDLHLVDADLALGDTADRVPNMSDGGPVGGARDSVLASHGATTAEFDDTVTWWAERPEEFLTLYEDVLEKINRMSM